MPDRLHRKINIQGRPVQVIRRRALHAVELGDGGLAEPGKLRKRDIEFLVSQPEAKPFGGDVGNLNPGSAWLRPGGFHQLVSWLAGPDNAPNQGVPPCPFARPIYIDPYLDVAMG